MKKIIALILTFFILSNFKSYQTYPVNNLEETVIPINETINNDVIGTIEFIRLKQTREIHFGTEDKILDKDVVGMHILSEKLDKRPNTIVLAGHNNKKVFNIITKLKVKDKVILNSLTDSYQYKVISIEKVSKKYQLPFDSNTDKLILITCIEKNEKRLIVTLEEVIEY